MSYFEDDNENDKFGPKSDDEDDDDDTTAQSDLEDENENEEEVDVVDPEVGEEVDDEEE